MRIPYIHNNYYKFDTEMWQNSIYMVYFHSVCQLSKLKRKMIGRVYKTKIVYGIEATSIRVSHTQLFLCTNRAGYETTSIQLISEYEKTI